MSEPNKKITLKVVGGVIALVVGGGVVQYYGKCPTPPPPGCQSKELKVYTICMKCP